MSFTNERATSRWSDVFIASGAQLMGAAGTFLVMTTLVLALQEHGASGIEIAALIVAESLPMVVLGRITGPMIDRLDSRLLLIVAGFAQVASCFALASADTYPWTIAGAVALSTATAVAQPTRAALLPQMVTRDDLPKASAIGQTAGSIGMMIGPAAAGLLVGSVAAEQTLRIAAFGFLATVLAGVLLHTRRGGAAARAAGAEIGAGPAPAYRLADDRMLWITIWGMALVIGLVSAVNVVEVFFIRDTLSSSATVYGIVGSGWVVGMLGGAWLMARLIRSGTADTSLVRWMFLSLGGVGSAVLLCGTVPGAAWVIPCWIAGGLCNGSENVIMSTLLGRRVPAASRGRAAAGLQSRVQGSALIGYAAGGVVLELTDARWILIGAGLLGLIAVLAITPLIRRVSAPAALAAPAPQAPEAMPVTVAEPLSI